MPEKRMKLGWQSVVPKKNKKVKGYTFWCLIHAMALSSMEDEPQRQRVKSMGSFRRFSTLSA